MTHFQDSAPRSNADDIDLSQVIAVLRRAAAPILVAPLLLSVGTYLLSSQQPPVYEAMTSVMAAQADNSNSVLNSSNVSAPPLPQGAVQEVVRSRTTVARSIGLINESKLSPQIKTAIASDLQDGLATYKTTRIKVKARLDNFQRGVYEIHATGETPEAAQILAWATTKALLEWDALRARSGVTRSRQNLQNQLNSVTKQLESLPEGSVERQSLIASRGQLLLNLSQASVLEESARGTLTLLADANAPRKPISPKPLRNSALVLLLSLFGGAGLALLIDALQRRVRTADDLAGFNVPVLAELPKLRETARSNIAIEARRGLLYEASGFLRVNLSSMLPEASAIIAVTSAQPGDGKSTTVTAIATAYALASRKVLVIDMDMHRPMQHEFWPQQRGSQWVPLPGNQTPGPCNVVEALVSPNKASAQEVAPNIHVLPSGPVGNKAASVLSRTELSSILTRWAVDYDLIIIDTPPILAVADAFAIAPNTDGLVLVAGSNKTTQGQLERILKTAKNTNVRILGVVLNRVASSERTYYSYNYTSQSEKS